MSAIGAMQALFLLMSYDLVGPIDCSAATLSRAALCGVQTNIHSSHWRPQIRLLITTVD